MHNVIRGFPQIVMRSVEDDLHPRVAVLQSLGIPPNEVGRMVEMFPTLLSLDVDEQIMPVLYFLQVGRPDPPPTYQAAGSTHRPHGHALSGRPSWS